MCYLRLLEILQHARRTFYSSLNFSPPTAVPSTSLRQRHTKQKGGFVDVMVLIAENANTAGLEHRR